jgi:hypothetical protein
MHSRRLPLTTLALSAALLPFLPACNDSSSGGSGSSGTADILIHDAPVDDLLSFSAEIRSVRMRLLSGAFTSDLLRSGEVRVEFLGLNESSVLLVRTSIPTAEYTAVEIGFTPGEYLARAETGFEVPVTAASDTYVAELPATLTVATGDYVRVDVDLDLSTSVSGNVGGGNVAFAPEGSATFSDGATALSVRSMKARVTEIDEAGGRLTVEAFADDSQSVSLGERSVRTDTALLFMDLDDSTPTGPLFYDELVAGQTLLEVHGALGPNGEIQASRIDIEDHSRGAGSVDVVFIGGTVVGLDVNSFRLRIDDVEDGRVLAQPILLGLPNPSVVDVTFDAGTVFVLGKTVLTDDSALGVGRKVGVKFCSFAISPFAACVVDISDSAPKFEGLVTSVAGAPSAFVMRLAAHDPAVLAGLVQNSVTDVEVDLGASQIVFDGAGDPVLLPSDLAEGLELESTGTLGGTPLAPTFAPSQVRVSGGRLEGATVGTLDPSNSRFTTTGGTLVDSFGPSVTTGSQQIVIQPGAVFTGAARSSAELFTLLGSPQGAASSVSMHGLGNGTANEIRAYGIHTKLP